jgi:hypothetical protein
MRPLLVSLLTCAALAAPSLAASGCTGDSHEHSAVTADVPANVVFQGAATDEALAALLASTLQPGGSVTLLEPTSPTYSIADAGTFRWSVGTLAHAVPRRGPSFFASVAHAHGAALTGTASYVRFVDAAGTVLAAAFTTAPGYNLSTTDLAAFAAARSAAGTSPATLKVELTAARFEHNRVVEGPFTAPTSTFTLAP